MLCILVFSFAFHEIFNAGNSASTFPQQSYSCFVPYETLLLIPDVFAMASNPSEACLPADIRITATYFDPMDLFVCSGTVTISQSAHVQNTSLEFRPYELEVFLKWWDGATLKQQALLCRDYQGNEMRNPTDFAASLRVYATVFPKRGGLSTSEIQINLPRFQRP